MRVNYKCLNGHLEMTFYPNDNEGIYTNKQQTKTIVMKNTQCGFILPNDWSLDHIHPDVLALATILIIYPFTKEHIQLSIGVSPYFAEMCKTILKKNITPIDPSLTQRRSLPHAKLSLAYSGGVDSTAALLLIPPDSTLFFTDRIIPPFVPSLYHKESAYHACDTLKNEGRNVYLVATDFEYIREPIGFPVDLACTIPGLLLSDYEPTNSIATGMILESAYGIGHEAFKDYPRSWHYNVWGTLFKSVDLPLSLVTAGLSEVATSAIVSRSRYASIAQSCMRASLHKPCMRCNKCIRKVMLDHILTQKHIPLESLKHFFTLPIAPIFFATGAMHHQDVMTYITSHYHGDYEPMNLFKHRMGGDVISVDWLEKWYSPALEIIADTHKSFIETKILEQVNPLSLEENQQLEAWNLTAFLKTDNYITTSTTLFNLLTSLKSLL